MAEYDDEYDEEPIESNDIVEETEDVQDSSEDYPEESELEAEDFPEDVDDEVEEMSEESEPETEDFPEDVDDEVEEVSEESEPETEDFPEDVDDEIEEESEESEPETEDFPEDVDDTEDIQDEIDANGFQSVVEEKENESIEWYGHGGDEAPTYDWAASYPESHYVPTDDQYQYKESEDTYATNQRALRELNEFEQLQKEDTEYEDRLLEQQEAEEWEEEQQELEYIEDVAESEVNDSDAKMAKCETEEERNALKAENDEAHRRLDNTRYDSGHHYRGM